MKFTTYKVYTIALAAALLLDGGHVVDIEFKNYRPIYIFCGKNESEKSFRGYWSDGFNFDQWEFILKLFELEDKTAEMMKLYYEGKVNNHG